MEDTIAAMIGLGKPKPRAEPAAEAQQAEVLRPETYASQPPPAAAPASPPNAGAASTKAAASPAREPTAAADAAPSLRRSGRSTGSGEAADN